MLAEHFGITISRTKRKLEIKAVILVSLVSIGISKLVEEPDSAAAQVVEYSDAVVCPEAAEGSLGEQGDTSEAEAPADGACLPQFNPFHPRARESLH